MYIQKKGLGLGEMFRPKRTINRAEFHKLDSYIMLEAEKKQKLLNPPVISIFTVQENVALIQ